MAVQTLVNVTLPEMGESVSEGSIVEWRKKVGDWVDEGDTIVDVTTDKVDVEVPSTASGVITALHGDEGATVNVGAVLAEIDTTASKPADTAGAPRASGAGARGDNATQSSSKGESATSAEAAPKGELVTPPSYGAPGSAEAPAERRGNGKPGGVLSHHARRLVERLHIDASKLTGTGPDGLILREDVEAAVASGKIAFTGALGSAAAPPTVQYPPVSTEAKVADLKGSSATLASYMEQSLTIPVATSFRTLHVGTLEQRRAELNNALKHAGRSEKVSFTHIIAFALARAATEQPAITASFRRTDGKPQRVEAGIHLGLAVDTQRKDGSRFLVVPVIKNAGSLDFPAFRATYEELIAKARDNKLSVDEQTGATFTLTNPGGIGTVASVPRLQVGQGAIIAAGAIAFPPGFAHAPRATLEQLGVEKVMTLTSTYDHRVIQGAQSGEYLKRVDELLAGADQFYETLFSQLGVQAKVRGVATSANGAAATREEPEPITADIPGLPSEEMLRAIAAGMAIVSAYRRHGHLGAALDPLGGEPPNDPTLDPATYGLTPAMMQAIPASVLNVKLPGKTLADVLPKLRETYSSTIAYEIEHISNTQQREWLREYIETGKHKIALSPQRRVQVLERLIKVETMERYFRKQFMSQKTFSIEGLDVMVPMLEETISMLAEDGTKTVVLGMAHRGRLSTIAHVVNRPYEELLSEFESASRREEKQGGDDDATGDVKYHHGAHGEYVTPVGTKITVELASNPSHLEAVDAVVEGMTRCLQTDHSVNPATLNHEVAAPILIHGDAAFAAQGVVAEVLNLQGLAGYATGGTIHIISNNQVGFTTDPGEGRSTRYASDLAKGYDVPIVHVNADDVDASIGAVHLAIDYRRKFGRDVVVDLIGYRRFGHNEQDEPAYTQPTKADLIKVHPTVRELYAGQLVAQGVLTNEQVKEMMDTATARISEAHRNVKSGEFKAKLINVAVYPTGNEPAPDTRVDKTKLLKWAEEVVHAPDGFRPNRKLQQQFAKRTQALKETGEVDWGLAEALAFASLLTEGTPIRLSGQDTERGTFSHRHAVLHDARSNAKYVPLQHLNESKASFEIYNSPLSEYACLGFEYGYGFELPNALVLWEAQFGDFNNGAQIVIDQFIAAGAAKWGQQTRLTLLLPHAYEGAGPEHSSARLERFLQLSAEGNIRVANCSTAAQYFHLLRAQAKATQAYPLVVMTPKSLLRNRAAYGTIHDLAEGTFREVINDPRYEGKDKHGVERVLLCSGHIYYDLIASPLYEHAEKTAIVRVELLSPLPTEEILRTIASYANAQEVIWVQEEPKNMGARAHVRRRLVERLRNGLTDIEYVGRPYRASPSEGYPGAHAVEQERIVQEAFSSST
ncbi:MAG: multifunctional oxoglutarate decarboxylase/oxoglutarate dehydrogenase thiamine pyrophosphate-binding subunit/dihydrolipoyllysine-residue succinyltransferase subunit [Candidatus Eremiobacteraeota bacterium]|nr:multifunctional oxoglutarate decarboxylase/oxoglutarate dehydrogenase thiamine pyrophosphate-binding subunit/dihydrolipoyllysine-residue succinyltransferase subunit [Candidatus Eremiobacteraeota bacterium]